MGKLKGAANSMAQSFNSLMNYSTDYVMEIIAEQMKKNKIKKVAIDILKGTISPKALSIEEVAGVIPLYLNMLDNQMRLSKRSKEDVKSARFIITPTGKKQGEWKTYAVECEIVLENGQKSMGRHEADWLEKTEKNWLNFMGLNVLTLTALLLVAGFVLVIVWLVSTNN